jgi:hypothetical protein
MCWSFPGFLFAMRTTAFLIRAGGAAGAGAGRSVKTANATARDRAKAATPGTVPRYLFKVAPTAFPVSSAGIDPDFDRTYLIPPKKFLPELWKRPFI